MATRIHSTALVDSRALLGANVEVGPFCVVEAGVRIGDDCRLAARAIVKSHTSLGASNEIGEGAVLGAAAQHPNPDLAGTLLIGDRNQIRENVTIHRSATDGAATVIENDNLLMVSSHVGHDCKVGSRCTLVNHVLLAAFVEVHDGACLGGAVTVAEHCRIGRLAMIGAVTRLSQDVPPYVTVSDSLVVGLNRVGLARNGFQAHDLLQLKAAYHLIYRQGLRWADVMAVLQSEYATGPAAEFHRFMSNGRNGMVQERRLPRKATLKLTTVASVDDITDECEPPAARSSRELRRRKS